jgi:parallel beta-helix repeat protein
MWRAERPFADRAVGGGFLLALGFLLLLAGAICAGVVGPPPAEAQGAPRPAQVPIVDDLVITQSVELLPGVYNVEDVNEDGLIIIAGDDITLDGSGVFINGLDFGGYGIVMDGHTGLALHNFDIRGFCYGVRIQNAQDVLVEDSNLSGNYKDTTSSWLDINVSWGYYGGGILFENVYSSTVQSNTLTNQSTGVELFGSHDNTILSNTISSGPEGNETGQNSCWGVRLHSSTHNLIQDNEADYVDRERYGLSSGDSAGVLLVVGSHENEVTGNSFTHSGDGFFIGNEWGSPSNHNYIHHNDGSYSPHNAFETTFSDGNTFEENIASHSHFGFWLGYSHNTRVTANQIADNFGEGIAIEHGHDNEIDHNLIVYNPGGIHLWDGGSAVDPSTGYLIHNNTIMQNSIGAILDDTDVVSMTYNQVEDNVSTGVLVDGVSLDVALAYNHLVQPGAALARPGRPVNLERPAPAWAGDRAQQRYKEPPRVDPALYAGYAVYNDMSTGYDVSALHNWWGTTERDEIEAAIFDHLDDPAKGTVHYDPFLTEPIFGTGLVVNPDALAATVAQGGNRPALVTVHNFTTATVTYTVATSPTDWLLSFRPGGSLAAGGAHTLAFGLDAGSLDPGAYHGNIMLSHSAPDSPEVVPVSLLVVGGGCGPLLGAWSETTPLPIPSAAPFENQRGGQLVFFDDYVYVFGGRNAGEFRLTEVYYNTVGADGTLGTWTETTSLPGLYYDHVEVRVGGYVYLLTGAAGSTAAWYAALNPDGSLGGWVSTASLSPSRQNFAAAAYGDYVYASGGNSGGTWDAVQYSHVQPDGSLGGWAYSTPLPAPTEGHSMVAYDGTLYVLAPDGSTYYAPLLGDASVGDWSPAAPLPAAMISYAAFAYNGYLYLLDGGSPAVYYALVLGDHTLSAWQATAWRPALRQAARVGGHNCFAYSLGGWDGEAYHDTVYYAPLQTLLSGVSIAGPALGELATGYAFTATAGPPTATLPILFDWQASGLAPLTGGTGISSTVTFSWTTAGSKIITVTAGNPAGPVWDRHLVVIRGPTTPVYLPLVVRDY